MVEFRFFRKAEILPPVARKDRPMPYYRFPSETREDLLKFLNEKGADGWLYHRFYSDFFTNDGGSPLLMVKERTTDLYEYRLIRYDEIRRERDGHHLFSEVEEADDFIKNITALYNDGWKIVDFLYERDGVFVVLVKKATKKKK